MSITTLPPHRHPVLAVVAAVEESVNELCSANLWSLTDAEALQLRLELERLSARVSGERLRATREIDTRNAAVAAGAASTTAWLVNAAGQHPGEAARELRLAAALDRDLPTAARALSDGRISAAAAAVIAESDRALSGFATAGQRSEAEALLVAQAPLVGIRGLQHMSLHLRHVLDPDDGDRLADDEREQTERREFRLRANPDGSATPGGHLDKEAAAFLRAALDPLAKPRPADDGGRDRRNPARRMGDALVELAELALRSEQLPAQAGQPVQVAVTISWDDLQIRLHGKPTAAERPIGGIRPGLLDLALPLSVGAARRLACDAQILPVVLGSADQPLDIGRAARPVTPAIRRALDLRDRGCAFPGCDRPPRWCQAHHICHWADGGPTSCQNCVLLCSTHHRTVHHHGWDVRIEPDGLPSFYPPAWVDPDRRPRRNHRLKPHPPDGFATADVLTFPSLT